MSKRLGGIALLAVLGSGPVVASALVDPTRPADYAPTVPVTPPAPTTGWTVNGITISRSARSAIVNGVVVVPGQIIGTAAVVEIRPGAVVLDQGGERITVRLLEHSVKHPVSD